MVKRFTFFPNDVVVNDFRIDIGTERIGAGKSNLARVRNLPPSGGAYTTPTLPAGELVYVSLIYRYSPTDSYKRVLYEFTVVDDSHAANLISELGCGVDELIKTNETGMECVPIAELVSNNTASFSICSSESGSWSGLDTADRVCTSACTGSSVIAAKIITASRSNNSTTTASCRVESEIGDGCSVSIQSPFSGAKRGSCCVCR